MLSAFHRYNLLPASQVEFFFYKFETAIRHMFVGKLILLMYRGRVLIEMYKVELHSIEMDEYNGVSVFCFRKQQQHLYFMVI